MRIGIDARSMSIKGGVRTYIINLINEIAKIDQKNDYFIYYDSKENLGTFKFNNFKEVLIKNNSRLMIPFWEQIKLKNILLRDKINIFHGTKNTIPILLSSKIKSVVTIHDTTPFIFKKEMSFFDRLYWKTFIPLTIKKASKIISISNSTKKDIIELFPKVARKIKVIYLGRPNNIKLNKNDKKDFFIMVGAIRARKNILRVIEALNKIYEHDKKIKLYVIGKDLNNYKSLIEKKINSLGLQDNIKIKGYLKEKELNRYYETSKGYLYPSLYEGFGLPILEAQANGCPVITSNISSMPEVAGKGAILVNPYSIEDIASAMEKLLKDQNLAKKLVTNGYNNLERFSWKKMAEETLRVYGVLANGKK